ncbi:MAG: hypothetical protein NTW87_00760 [Planctomycetota bacterium]|nr:hypothetical protein [Planctomycetota bacterium]
MPGVLTWRTYFTACARHVQEDFIHLRGHKQRKRAIARLYPLSRAESNPYRRYLWTRICRALIELRRLQKRPGRFRLDSERRGGA